jgi:hypothetical protein
MSNVIKLKRSEIAGAIPSASDLAVGEIAFNAADKKIFTKNSIGVVTTIASVHTPADTLSDITARGATSADALTLTNATASTSKTTGALKITGGVGVAGKLNAGSIGVNDVYTLPTVDGSPNYVLSTDGSGNVTWIPNGSGFASVTSPSQTSLSAITSSALAIEGGSGISVTLDSILNKITITNTGLASGSFASEAYVEDVVNTEVFPTGDYGDFTAFSPTLDAFGIAITSARDYDLQGYTGYLRTVNFGTL